VQIEAESEPRSSTDLRLIQRLDVSPSIAVFVVALPVLFVHASFQPTLQWRVGSTVLQFRLSDLAVIAIAAAAALSARRDGVSALRRGRAIWPAAGAFLLFVIAASFYPLVTNALYPWRTHLVTAVKYAEYSLIALSVPLLLRRARDVLFVVSSLVAVSVAATVVAVLQFFGVAIFSARPSGERQPSFVGIDDFGMLSAAAFAVALAVIAVGPRNRSDRVLAGSAGVGGVLGMILSGALASVLGAMLAAAVAVVAARRLSVLDLRRATIIGSMTAVVIAGSFFMRSAALGSFARFAGLGHERTNGHVESYSQRWVLDYVGLKIFLRHPVLGAGWQAGFDRATYGPVLPAARRRFPSQPALAFPSPAHPWGIQNAYVEAMAELGLVGAALFAAWIVSGFVTAARFVRRDSVQPQAFLGLLWLCVALGVWNGLWFIGGNPFDALIWLAFGFAAAPVAQATTGARP
jgi:hypothetical protein